MLVFPSHIAGCSLAGMKRPRGIKKKKRYLQDGPQIRPVCETADSYLPSSPVAGRTACAGSGNVTGRRVKRDGNTGGEPLQEGGMPPSHTVPMSVHRKHQPEKIGPAATAVAVEYAQERSSGEFELGIEEQPRDIALLEKGAACQDTDAFLVQREEFQTVLGVCAAVRFDLQVVKKPA